MARGGLDGVLARAERAFELFLYYLSAVLLIAISAIVFYVVVMRYFFSATPQWGEDVPRVLFLWMSYLAIVVATKRGQNLRVTFLIDKFAPLPRLLLELFMHAMVVVMLAALVWHNQPILELQAGTRMLSTGWSNAVSYLPLSVGCALLVPYQIYLGLRSWREYREAAARRAG